MHASASFLRRPAPVRSRRGAALVETAVVMTVLLALVLGALDLSLAVFRYNSLSAAARRGAREASVHGRNAPPRRSAWGPDRHAGTAADDAEIAQAVRPLLPARDPADVSIELEWLDGDNDLNRRVRCTVSAPHRLIVASFLGSREITLTAASTMRIAH